MAAISANVLGADLTAVNTPGSGPTNGPLFRTGQTVIGDDGALYQYAVAGASITASTAVVNITESGGVYTAAASGGSSLSPATDMASGDYAFFQL